MKEAKSNPLFKFLMLFLLLGVGLVYATTTISDTTSSFGENITLSDGRLNITNSYRPTPVVDGFLLVSDGSTPDHTYTGNIVSRLTYNNTGGVSARGLVSEIFLNHTKSPTGQFYNAFWANAETVYGNVNNVTTALTNGGLIAMQGNIHHKGDGVINNAQVLRLRGNNEANGTLNNTYNVYIVGGDNVGVNGVYNTEYGIYIDDKSQANEFISLYSKNGRSYFRDEVGIGKNMDNSTRALQINASGSLTPKEPLQIIARGTSSTYTSAGHKILLHNDADTDNSWVSITMGDSSAAASASIGTQIVSSSNNYGEFVIYTRSADGYDEMVRVTGNSIVLGPGDRQVNLTMTAPGGTEFTCGVNDAGTFQCS